jgi:PiT family inorganic phosphate transporter
MPDVSFWLLIISITLALGLGVANGFNDAANAIATVIGTRVLSPRAAIVMAAFLNFAGAATGTLVAYTIGKGILNTEALSGIAIQYAVVTALLSVGIWVALASRLGMPVSSSHGLVAALAGAGVALGGSGTIAWSVLEKIFLCVIFAPTLGFAAGFVVMLVLMWLFHGSTPARVGDIFGNLQILSAGFMAYSHGKNDGQMPMGIIALALMSYYGWSQFSIPLSVMVISALSISAGTAFGGWRVIRTLGVKITNLRPVHGFAAESSAAAVIELASAFGMPVSTTHCISTAIMGVGSTRRFSAVRWGLARSIIITWIVTFPICAALGWLFASISRVAL